jgi:two-component system, sensor histidine kinase and response regulator
MKSPSTTRTPKRSRRSSRPSEIEELRTRLSEAEETLRAIREGEVDAVIVSGEKGEQIYSLVGAESVYRLIVETMREAAFTVTVDGQILFCNARFGEFVNRPMERIIGNPLRDFVALQSAADAEALLIVGRKQPIKQRLVFRGDGGTTVPAYVSTTVLNEPGRLSICIVATDLTDLERSTELVRQLRRQQEALRESEERLRLATSATRDAVWDIDLVKGTVHWNEAYTAAYGRPPETADSWQWWIDHIHPEDRERAVSGLRAAIDGTDGLWTCDYRFLRANGTWADIYDRACIARDASGRAWRVIGAMMDQTDRKRTERQLFETSQRLQALMNALPVGVSFSNDPSCQDITGNPAVLAQFEADVGDNLSASAPDDHARGRQVKFFHRGRQITDAELPLQRAVGENQEIPSMDLEVVMPSGRRWYAEASGAPIRDSQGNVVGGVAVTVDITDRKAAEEALRHANENLEHKVRQRTNELRRLSGELLMAQEAERRRISKELHDELGQALTLVKMRISLIKRNLTEDQHVLKGHCESVSSQIAQLIEMGRQLARRLRPAAIEDLGLTTVVRQLAADTTEASNIRVSMEFDEIDHLLPPQSHIMLYRVFQESLTNIMRHSGATEATLSARHEDGHILIEVRDNGQGMDLEKVESARETGLGGLGLTTMTERVRTLGGSLEIWSQKGIGTRLSFSVPATERPER